jgi:hypothetical protein
MMRRSRQRGLGVGTRGVLTGIRFTPTATGGVASKAERQEVKRPERRAGTLATAIAGHS